MEEDRLSAWYILADTCRQQRNRRAVWTRERSLTYGEFHDLVAKYAQWLLEQGVQPGDLVALYLLNSAEFLAIMFACQCVGTAPALLNYNLEGRPLHHSLDVCASKILIVDPDTGCQNRIAGSKEHIESKGTKIFTLDADLKRKVEARSAVVPEDKWRKGMKGDFPYCLLYTSGTTGLPKGCSYTLQRQHSAG